MPEIIEKIIINKINTIIFALFTDNILLKLEDAPTNLFIFRILKTLINLRALSDAKELAPVTNNEIYLGTMDNKSIMP